MIEGLPRATDLGIGYGGASTDLLFERLRSEGFLVQAFDAQTLPSSSARVLILGEGVRLSPALLQGVREGRALLAPLREALAWVEPASGIRFNVLGQLDARWRFHRGHAHPAPTLPVYRCGAGHILTYPDGIGGLLSDHVAEPVSFKMPEPATVGRTVLWERLARTGKNVLIRFLRRLLFEAAVLAQVPVVKVGHTPLGRRAAFNFRFDCDGASVCEGVVPEHFNALLTHCQGLSHCLNWFVNVRDYLPHAACIKAAFDAGMEVGSHGTLHTVFSTPFVQRENLAIAHDFLSRFGPLAGYSSPAGIYSRATSAFLAEHRLPFSADLRFDYDGLPYRMFDTVGPPWVWQFPTHPICMGRFTAAGMSLEDPEVPAYYQALREYRALLREPAFIYCHPENRLGRYPKVFRAILEMFLNDSRFWPVTYGRYLQWLIQARALHISAWWDGDKGVVGGTVEGSLPDPAPALEVWWPDATFQTCEARPTFQCAPSPACEALSWGLEAPGPGDPYMDPREAVPANWIDTRRWKPLIKRLIPRGVRDMAAYLRLLRPLRRSLRRA
jgi:hypothetical protein